MKYLILSLMLSLLCSMCRNSSSDSDNQELILNEPQLIVEATQEKQPYYNSMLVKTFFNDQTIASATCFLCSYKKKLFLVANYHVFVNKLAIDTLTFQSEINLTPNRIEVDFYAKDTKSKITKSYNLMEDGKRIFYSYPVYRNQRLNKYSTFDVTVLPVSLSDERIIINPIEISGLDTTWICAPNSNLFMYGFPGGANNPTVTAETIMRRSSEKRSFSYNDLYIVTQENYASLKGASGSPTFLKRDSTNYFVGMLAGSYSSTPPYTNLIISGRYVKQLLVDRR